MKIGFLSKYFPPPQFLKPHHIGMAFSDSYIKVVSKERSTVRANFKSLVIPLDPGTITGGKISNPETLKEKLLQVKKEFSNPFVFFAIPDELAYIFTTTIPIAEGVQVSEAIAFGIEENVPLTLADTTFDFEPSSIVGMQGGYGASVVVTATMKKEIEKYIKVISDSGLEAVGAISESQAIANSVIKHGSQGTFCIVHSREDRIGIYLVKNNIVQFATIRGAVNGDFKKQFLDEFDKFLEYSIKYGGGEKDPITTIFVCGEFQASEQAIEAIMAMGSKVPSAKLANVWTNLLKIEETTPNISYENSLNLAGPIGTIISDIIY